MTAGASFRFELGVSVVLGLVWGSAVGAARTVCPRPEFDVGDEPHSVAISDLDGDGDAELAVVNCLSENVSMLLNYGDETFATDGTYSVRSVSSGRVQSSADIRVRRRVHLGASRGWVQACGVGSIERISEIPMRGAVVKGIEITPKQDPRWPYRRGRGSTGS